MRVTYLLADAAGLWGGVKIALAQANALVARGHDVRVVSMSRPPNWFELACEFLQVEDFTPDAIPDSDLIVCTDWVTVPPAVHAEKGQPVHLVQGYEGCFESNRAHRDFIEEVYRLPVPKIAISQHLQRSLQDQFQQSVAYIPNMVDHQTMYPVEPPRPLGRPIRVGLVGPMSVGWKDIQTGLETCAAALRRGLDLEIVRVSNTVPDAEERELPLPMEWHVKLDPAQMGEVYRTLDIMLGSSKGHEEGFHLPAVEAMACGVPCVLTDIPCFRGHGTSRYAQFAPPQDPESLADALISVAQNPELRAELRANGLRVAAQYTKKGHMDGLEESLKRIHAATLVQA